MKRNMGNLDRIIRILIALVIGGLYFTQTITGTLAIILLLIGGIFVLTSTTSFCPLYLAFGMSSCAKEK